MPKLCHRLKTLEAIRRSAVHQSLATPSSQLAMARSKTATLSDPVQAIEMLRSLLQNSINEEIRKVLAKFRQSYFVPAAANATNNLGQDNVSIHLVDQVCINALEQAKVIYSVKKCPPVYNTTNGCVTSQTSSLKLKRRSNSPPESDVGAKKQKLETSKTDLILVYKSGKPVRREGVKWDANRLKDDTLFILGSKANKALGFGQTRGRLYIKHPELFKYSGDQEDKEWLAKNQLMSTTGGKAYLMVLSDIVELASMPEYASNPRQQPDELVGFQIPPFMLEKMRCFMSTVRTKETIPDTSLIKEGERQMTIWEEERKKFLKKFNNFTLKPNTNSSPLATPPTPRPPTPPPTAPPPQIPQPPVIEIKTEEEEILLGQSIPEANLNNCAIHSSPTPTTSAGEMTNQTPAASNTLTTSTASAHEDEDELGFLHGMNLTNLVKELEGMENGGDGAGNLDSLLSLADDDAEDSFPELNANSANESQEKQNH